MTTTVTSRHPRAPRHAPLSVTIASWAVPFMVVAQYALIAGVPVAIALVGALRHVRDRAVRLAAVLVAVSYAVPLAVWLIRPDGAQSLSKDMHPGFAGLIVAASALLLATLYRARRLTPDT
ncbi:hypothetical protein A6A06_37735 [Streptomyces sp. CB02923]|uniref:hypothetical protein n=1 Tax=Streptomyces sp. CB02923 TaxID=1718985 RepID=UPI00093DAEB6|nr:hypothetical protein [Streptomyces sp. CB02923]OKI06243.1 hypothetical protein A6A06_37735 [Streptomyces sp. CB02923]